MTTWGVDWSTKNVAIAAHTTFGDGTTVTRPAIAFSRGDGPPRLLSLFARTRELAQAMREAHGPPDAVFIERAFGNRRGQEALHQAYGVVRVALWSVLHTRLPVEDFVETSTTQWRSWVGLRPVRDGDEVERRRARKRQQLNFAARFVDVDGLTEHEADAVCIAVAGAWRRERVKAA